MSALKCSAIDIMVLHSDRIGKHEIKLYMLIKNWYKWKYGNMIMSIDHVQDPVWEASIR